MHIQNLQNNAKEIRKIILNMIYRSKSSHIGSAFSIVDILTALYFETLNIDPKNSHNKTRDRFILSKGHACTALYATLGLKGFFPISKLDEYGKDNTKIAGHITLGSLPGIEATAGSLGHGLSIGAGMALAAKKDNKKYKIFVLVGDGECNEGSVWEAILFASQFKLDNLILIIDKNNQQGLGSTQDIMNINPLPEKLKSFGWEVKEVDGHDINDLIKTFKNLPFKQNKPSAIIAHTIKGKGVSFMENNIDWHYRPPNDDQYKLALSELK
jgi:transketolase